MSLDALQLADVLRSSAPELERIWRAARAEARRGVSPGLIDGIVPAFLSGIVAMLEMDGEPSSAWGEAVGIVRFDSHDRAASAAEIDAEWAIMGAALESVCLALEAEPATRVRLAEAVASARAGAAEVLGGRGPPGVLALPVLSGMARGRSVEVK